MIRHPKRYEGRGSGHIWIHRPEEDPDWRGPYETDEPTTRFERAWLGVLWATGICIGVAVVAADALGIAQVGGARP